MGEQEVRSRRLSGAAEFHPMNGRLRTWVTRDYKSHGFFSDPLGEPFYFLFCFTMCAVLFRQLKNFIFQNTV